MEKINVISDRSLFNNKRVSQRGIVWITNQIRRASTSVPANIAEGATRKSTRYYLQFLNISRGSLAELETFLTISYNLKYIDDKTLDKYINQTEEIGRMLNGLINSLNNKLSLHPEA